MSNFHADKARGLLNLAETKRVEVMKLWEKGPLNHADRFDIAWRQDDITATVLAAQVHATLATVGEVVNIENVTVNNPPEPEEAPKDPGEDEPSPADILDGLADAFEFIRAVSPVIRLIAAPRPVKDTPQA